MGRTVCALAFLVGCTHAARWDPAHPTPGGPPPPELLSPTEWETLESPRPPLRWRLPLGVEGAVLDLCRDKTCAKSLAHLVVRGEATEPSSNLGSGIYWIRARSFAGVALGRWTEPAPFAVNLKMAVEGKHVDIIVPREQRRFAEKMIALGDRALERYSSLLGVPLSDYKCRVYFYLSAKTLERISLQWSHGKPETDAFTMWQVGSHILWRGSIDRPVADATGWWEVVTLHELAHSFQDKQVLLYRDQPKWLVEGIAELLADLAARDATGAPSLLSVYRLYDLREMLARKRFIPLAELLEIERDHKWRKPYEASLFYAEVYALLHYLDGASHDRLLAFLRGVSQMRGFAAAWRINRRFRAEFGDPAALEQKWLAALRDEKLPVWWPAAGETRVAADGALLIDSGPSRRAVAVRMDGTVGDGLRVEATVRRTPGDAQAAEIAVSEDPERLAYFVEFSDGGVALLRRERGRKDTERLAGGRAPAAGLLSGERHRIAVDVFADRVIAQVDGVELLRASAPFGRTAWVGVGAFDGHLTLRDVRVGPIPKTNDPGSGAPGVDALPRN